MWKLKLPPKVKMFVWMFLHNQLQTKGRLAKLIQNIDLKCPLCNKEDETQTHLFFDCDFAKLVQYTFNFIVPSDLNVDFNKVIDCLSNLGYVVIDRLSELSQVLILYGQIRNDRNNKHFRGTIPYHIRTMALAFSLGNSFFQANKKN